MKRAYPQYLAREGASLPDDVLRVTYPVNYWTLIKKYSAAHKLDPYLIAALIAQESGYDPAAKSGANAWGLMQIVPATGRSFARKLGIRRFTTRSLTDPVINIRIGTAYFADQIDRLGSVHAALAGYNAGPSRARRWAAERPGLERDEWIDDIPFPETQFYVKRILGTAEDYRALYSGGFDPALKRTSPRPRGASGGE
jgi:soluble lytic murein transglycosylase